MRFFIVILASLLMVGVADEGFAKKKKKRKKISKVYPWGMAGCGLGSRVFKRNTKGQQLGAFFLNSAFSATSSVTSTKSSSGCDKGPDLRRASIESEVYMRVNYAQIKKEAAQGGGKHLMAFYDTLGCDDQSKQKLASLAQIQYSGIFHHREPGEALNSLRLMVKKGHADSCSYVGST